MCLTLDQSLAEISACLVGTLSIFKCVYDFWLKKKKVLTSGPNCEILIYLQISKLIVFKAFFKNSF